jgi:membrane associated rhomboid family serine protease
MTPAPVGLRCPDHSGKPQGIQRVVRPAQQRATVARGAPNLVTLALIGINVAVYLAELAGGDFDSPSDKIFTKGVLFGPFVAQGDWWRLMTAAFLHAGLLHLLTNMVSLYFVGSILEAVIGRWRFILLYLACGIAGSAGALVWNPLSPTVGASGAIFGVLGALLVLERSRHIATGGQIVALIIINLVISFSFSSFISVGGHVGGLIAGIVLMWLMLQFRDSNALAIASVAGVIVVSVVIAYLKTRNYA